MSVQLSKISDMKATRSLPDYIMTCKGTGRTLLEIMVSRYRKIVEKGDLRWWSTGLWKAS